MFDWSSVATAFNEVPEDRFVILSPVIREILDRRNTRSIVDFGCGDGRFLSYLLGSDTKPQYLDLALYEPSEGMFKLALDRWGTHCKVVKQVDELPKQQWDAVMQVAVWMCLPNDRACIKMLTEVSDLLMPGGLFVAAVTHPSFRTIPYGTFRTNFDMSKYHDQGSSFDVEIGIAGQTVDITDYHWNFDSMTRQLDATGFRLHRIHELRDLDKSNHGSPWAILECMKG